MPERDGYIPGVPCWVDTSQPDPDAAVAFYGGLFGWELQDVMPPGSDGKYFIGRLGGGDVAAIAGLAEGAPPVASWNTYIWVNDADATAAKVAGAGGNTILEPFDVPNAGRMAVLADREGASFRLWQAREHKGARVVNESGALNFNTLSTRDAARAKSFYGAVFGWEPLRLLGGAEMWRLPGYGDYLERSDPGLRERVAQVGGPTGFEDVVAALSTITAEQGDVPASWGVTFSVDDADAIAERATELGGTVLVAPFDAPWVRMAVIQDPQGATFTASKFVAENRDLEAQTSSTMTAA